jgi:hypothetical protein
MQKMKVQVHKRKKSKQDEFKKEKGGVKKNLTTFMMPNTSLNDYHSS